MTLELKALLVLYASQYPLNHLPGEIVLFRFGHDPQKVEVLGYTSVQSDFTPIVRDRRVGDSILCLMFGAGLRYLRSGFPELYEVTGDTSCSLLVVTKGKLSVLNNVSHRANQKQAIGYDVQKADTHVAHPEAMEAWNGNDSDNRH